MVPARGCSHRRRRACRSRARPCAGPRRAARGTPRAAAAPPRRHAATRCPRRSGGRAPPSAASRIHHGSRHGTRPGSWGSADFRALSSEFYPDPSALARGPYARPLMLQFTRAAIGSTNPAKVAAVREALATLAPSCELLPLEVPSGVGRQPFGDVATRAGALERARTALVTSGADIAFGLEGGVELDGDRVWLLSWVAAIDVTGREGYASGLRMLLPPALGAGLRSGAELGSLVDD